MTGQPFDPRSLRDRVLRKARDLAQEVREIAERVHCQALEAQRLTMIAKQQSQRGQDLSRSGHQGIESVADSIKGSLTAALKAERRLTGKEESEPPSAASSRSEDTGKQPAAFVIARRPSTQSRPEEPEEPPAA
jgi:hypothetical protein